jgi:uncharacterized protein YegP (UPF0339 family)
VATAVHVGSGQVLRHFSVETKAVNYRFRIFQGSDSQWYITIEHVNGQALYTSEGYTTRQAALNTLENFIGAVRMFNPMHDSQALVAQHTISK